MASVGNAFQVPDAVGTGDRTASDIDWDELCRSYGPALRRLVASRVPSAYVEDVLQETFIRAYRSRGRVDLASPLWPWLVKLARRSCVDHWRVRRETPVADPLPGGPVGEPSPEDVFDAIELRSVVKRVLDSMPSRHRHLLTRSLVEAVPPAVIASAEGLSSETVRAALARARRGFRRRYEALIDGGGLLIALPGARTVTLRLRDRLRRLTEIARDGPSFATVGVAAGLATVAVLGVESRPVDSRPVSVPVEAMGSPRALSAAIPIASERSGSVNTPAGTTHPVAVGSASVDRERVRHEQPPSLVESPALDPAVGIRPEESYVRVRLDWAYPAKEGHGETSVEVKCDRSIVTRQACPVLRNVPGVESGG